MYGRARAIEETAETVDEAPVEAGLDESAAGVDDAITVGELEDARLGLRHLLARRFGREFVEQHGDDLFAQAAYEFSRKLAQGEKIENPAAWITRCGWNRAKTEIESRDWRPRLVPTESLPFEPIAEPSGQPEETFLSEDRVRKIHEAVEQLPIYQRQLLARHYFEGESVREASRRLGWSAGKGARAHNAARKKLNSIFDGLNSSDVEFEVGIMCFFSLCALGRKAAAEVPAGMEAALQRLGHGAAEGWHKAVSFVRHPLGAGRPADLSGSAPQPSGRLSQLGGRVATSPIAEAAAAGDGPGRLVEACKVLAVCAISGPTLVTAGFVGATHTSHPTSAAAVRPAPRHRRQRDEPTGERSSVAPTVPDPPVVEPDPRSNSGQAAEDPEATSPKTANSVSESRHATSPAPKEKSAEGETSSRGAFGAFGGRGESGSTESVSPAGESDPLDEETSSATPPAEAAEPAPTPERTAEKQAAAEQFHGAFR